MALRNERFMKKLLKNIITKDQNKDMRTKVKILEIQKIMFDDQEKRRSKEVSQLQIKSKSCRRL